MAGKHGACNETPMVRSGRSTPSKSPQFDVPASAIVRSFVNMLDRYQKIDDRTIAIYTKSPFSFFPYMVPTMLMVSPMQWEKAGLLEREMDLPRHRCQAIRLVPPHPPAPTPATDRRGQAGSSWDDALDRLIDRDRHGSELEAAQRELDDAIRRAAEASRRVEKLRWALIRADQEERVSLR